MIASTEVTAKVSVVKRSPNTAPRDGVRCSVKDMSSDDDDDCACDEEGGSDTARTDRELALVTSVELRWSTALELDVTTSEFVVSATDTHCAILCYIIVIVIIKKPAVKCLLQ